MSFAGETTKTCMRRRFAAASFLRDCRGVAAVEFAVIVPLMLVLLFATVEFSSGLAIDRKVSLVARTVANLTSQGTTASVADLTNYIGAASLIMVPYVQPNYPAPSMTISEVYIDPSTGNAKVQWSWGSTPRGLQSVYAALPASMIATDPTTHAILPNQYIIVSEVNTLYTPTLGFFGVMGNSGITLSDVAYALPRQSTCVFYPSTPSPANCPTGP
jgi:Flp pilus assembly protein TadG